MTERQILFSGPMVRALLDSSKTQTRRVVKPQFAADAIPVEMPATDPTGGWVVPGHSGVWWCDAAANPEDVRRCPYGQPGDRLWVRESFSGPHHREQQPPRDWHRLDEIHYWADGNPEEGDWTKPRPGMFMPRWASRITLETTEVRVERLQDISEADALAEGIAYGPTCDEEGRGGGYHWGRTHEDEDVYPTAVQAYRQLWMGINGPDSWDANLWVWVVSFRRLP